MLSVVDIANAMSADIDVIVSGHTHRAYVCTIGSKLVTSAASLSRLITDIDLTVDRGTGRVVKKTARNVVVTRDGEIVGLPFGPFDPAGDRTLELSLRGWVKEQTGFDIGYVEQLYTFGDRGRDIPLADIESHADRVISISYLALTPSRAVLDRASARWRSWYDFFPWEDWREGEDELTSGWMRATSPSGDATFRGVTGWSGELGYGVRTPEPPQPESDR